MFFSKRKIIFWENILVFSVFFTMFVSTLFFWKKMELQEKTLLQNKNDLFALKFSESLSLYVNEHINAIDRMGNRWELGRGTERFLWENDALEYIRLSPGYQAIEWVDREYYVRWVVPAEGNRSVLDLNLNLEDNRKIELEKVAKNRKITITDPKNLIQGGKGFLIYRPLYIDEEIFDGFILAVIRYDLLFENFIEIDGMNGFEVNITDYEGNMLYSKMKSEQYGQENAELVKSEIEIPNLKCKIEVFPDNQVIEDSISPLPRTILFLGCLLSVLASLSVFLGRNANRLAKELKILNQELEIKVETRTEELEKSNAELKQFAYVASHDLQEPLRMISSYLELIEDRYSNKLDSAGLEFIKFAIDGSERMKILINALLDLSRIDSQGLPLTLTNCEEVLNDTLDILKIKIEESGAEITRDPMPTINADKTQLVQLFQNLISNSIKYCENETPKIHIGVKKNKKGQSVFCIKDNGIGIEEKYLDKIFIIFQRLHGHGKYRGAGIGLSLCKKIVERHGGKIWVESKVGEGSTFYFYLKED